MICAVQKSEIESRFGADSRRSLESREVRGFRGEWEIAPTGKEDSLVLSKENAAKPSGNLLRVCQNYSGYFEPVRAPTIEFPPSGTIFL